MKRATLKKLLVDFWFLCIEFLICRNQTTV